MIDYYPSPGSYANRFKVLKMLHSGKSFVVFHVTDESGNPLIMKFPQINWFERGLLIECFHHETRVLQRLNHPNIVKLHEAGTFGKTGQPKPYMIQEFIEGEDLNQLINDEAPLKPERALIIVRDIAEALTELHKDGFTHRYINPQNIRLNKSDMAILHNLGITEAIRVWDPITWRPIVRAKYMPHEQIEDKKMDNRVDLYALGVIFYELLTARLPYDSDQMFELARLKKASDPIDPCSINPEVSRHMGSVVMKLLSRDRDDGYDSAAQLCQGLDNLAHSKAIGTTTANGNRILKSAFVYSYKNRDQGQQEKLCAESGKPGVILKDRYRIEAKIGEGAYGTVYAATDLTLNGKLWAVKQIRPDFLPINDRDEIILNFYRESEILRNLDCKGLPKVTDAFAEKGSHYLVMEYIEGRTLREIIDIEKPEPHRVISWGIKICEILTYLHENLPEPIIFRDLKPSNIIINQAEAVFLVDFGIARYYNPNKSRDTVALGTPGYAAPEHYGIAQTDARSDIYSLGATLYEVFSGADVASFDFRFPPLKQLNIPINRTLDELISRCLERIPEKRYQNARMLRLDLIALRRRMRRDYRSTRITSIDYSRSHEGAPLLGGAISIDKLISAGESRTMDNSAVLKNSADRLGIELVLADESLRDSKEDIYGLIGKHVETSAHSYEIEDLLGAGEISAVYRAQTKDTKRSDSHHICAIKFYNPELVRYYRYCINKEIDRFQKLDHRFFVKIIDRGFCEKQNMIFYIMEVVNGQKLSELLKLGKPLDILETVKFASQILEALINIQIIESRMVTRFGGFNPDKIFITEKGFVKIIHHSYIKILYENNSLCDICNLNRAQSRFCSLSGQRAYDNVNSDIRSDLCSFGLILNQMLTGIAPPNGIYSASPRAHCRTALLSITGKYAIPQSLTEFILKMLETARNDRFQSVNEALMALKLVATSLDSGLMK